MEVPAPPLVDPNLGVTVRLRRDLPGYNVSRARRSPRLRWSLPVDIQWQSECIMKYLGQSCACCDVIAGDMTSVSETRREVAPVRSSRGHDTVYASVNSDVTKGIPGKHKVETRTVTETTKTVGGQKVHEYSESTESHDSQNILSEMDAIHQRLSPLGIDMFKMTSPPNRPGVTRKGRRRRQIISTTDMLGPAPELEQHEPSAKAPDQSTLSPFDIMRTYLGVGPGTQDTEPPSGTSSRDTASDSHQFLDDIREESPETDSTSKAKQNVK